MLCFFLFVNEIYRLNLRYKPEVGDIVIGRVIEVHFYNISVVCLFAFTPFHCQYFTDCFVQVAQNFWRLDINCNKNAYLMLSAMNMPDGVQVFCNSVHG